MSVEQTMVCDECGGIIAARRRLQDAKNDARSTGAYVPAKGSAAVCSDCRGMARETPTTARIRAAINGRQA